MSKSELFPDLFLQKLYRAQLRSDGRKKNVVRNPSIEVNVLTDTVGSSIVSVGKTTFVCGVTAEVGVPSLYAPESGRVIVNVEFPSLSPKICTYGDQLNVCLNKIFSNVHVLDLLQLCIKKEVAVWVLYVNIVCVSYDGSALDWSLAAAVAALANLTLPALIWDSTHKWWRVFSQSTAGADDQNMKTTTTVSSEEASKEAVLADSLVAGKKLVFKNLPIAVTISHMFNESWVIDPTFDEENHSTVYIIWRAKDAYSGIYTLQNYNSSSLSIHDVQAIISDILKTNSVVFDQLENSIMKKIPS